MNQPNKFGGYDVLTNSQIYPVRSIANSFFYFYSIDHQIDMSTAYCQMFTDLELANKGIRINIVSPGVTKSPIQKKSGMTDEAIDNLLNHFSDNSPIGRIVMPSDIAPIVEFLLSDNSAILRNEKIIIDGGTTL